MIEIIDIFELSFIFLGFYCFLNLNLKYIKNSKKLENINNQISELNKNNNKLNNMIYKNQDDILNKMTEFVINSDLNKFNEKIIELNNNLNKKFNTLNDRYDFNQSEIFELNNSFDCFKKINFKDFDIDNLKILKDNLKNLDNNFQSFKDNFNNLEKQKKLVSDRLLNYQDFIKLKIEENNKKISNYEELILLKIKDNNKIINKSINDVNKKINNRLNNKLTEIYNNLDYIKLEMNTYLDKTYMLAGFDPNTNMPIYVLRKNEITDYWNKVNMIQTINH